MEQTKKRVSAARESLGAEMAHRGGLNSHPLAAPFGILVGLIIALFEGVYARIAGLQLFRPVSYQPQAERAAGQRRVHIVGDYAPHRRAKWPVGLRGSLTHVSISSLFPLLDCI